MKKNSLFTLSLALLLHSGVIPQARSQVSGTIYNDTTWTNSSPVIVNGNVTISQLKTLTIQAGTTIKFNGGYSITVNGALIADGTVASPIRFTSNSGSPAAGNWGSISFTSQSGLPASALDNCIVEYAGTGISASGFVLPYSLSVTNSRFDQVNTGISASGCKVEVSGSKFTNIGATGLSYTNGATGTITADTVRDFVNYGIYVGGTGSNVQLQGGCEISQQLPARLRTGLGMYLENATTVSVSNIRITSCEKGIYAYSPGVATSLGLTQSTITQNVFGVFVEPGGGIYPSIAATGNDIFDNVGYNVRVGPGGSAWSTELNFTNNWWGTTDGVVIAEKIYDFTDNGYACVNYLPFLNASKNSGGSPMSANYKANWIHENTTWTAAGGPYVVTGRITVRNQRTLTIEPGTEIRFASAGTGIGVYGQLVAVGTPANPIVFTSNKSTKAAGDWGGVTLYGNGGDPSTAISNCRLEYAGNAIVVSDLNASSGSHFPTLSNLVIRDISGNGITANNSRVAGIADIVIANVVNGITTSGSTIETKIERVKITNAGSVGVNMSNTVAVLEADTVRDFVNYGIYVGGTGSNVQLQGGCEISQQLPARLRTGLGMYLENATTVSVSNIRITSCEKGIYAYSPGVATSLGLTQSTITQNVFGVFVEPGGGIYPSIAATGNDIFDNVGYNVRVGPGGSAWSTELNFTNNWWGTTDGVVIAEKIYDFTDNGYACVNYLPFLNASKNSGGSPMSANYKANWIHENTTWTAAGGPYVVTGRITVRNQRTLTIEPGTEIRFASAGTGIGVYGQLVAVGTPANPIVFTSNKSTKAAGDWGGVTLYGNGGDPSTAISNCRLEYAGNAIVVSDLNASSGSHFPTLSNLVIRDISGNGITANNSRVAGIADIVIANVVNGITTSGSTIETKIERVKITNAGSVGVNMSTTVAVLEADTVRDFVNYGIYVGGTGSNVQLQGGCEISQQLPARLRTGLGMYLENATTVSVSNSRIASCDRGIYAHSPGVPTSLGLTQSTITQNVLGVFVEPGGGIYPSIAATGNDIFDNVGYNVRVGPGGSAWSTELNFTNNWWGTTDGVVIAEKIYDFTDNGYAFVNYLPFLNASKNSGGSPMSANYKANRLPPWSSILWTAAEGPYLVIGRIVVPENSILTIEPGTEIRFASAGTGITVNGRFLSNGISASPIVYTSNRTTKAVGDWGGLEIGNTGSLAASSVSYSQIEYANVGMTINGNSASLNGPVFTNLTLRNVNTGFALTNAKVGTLANTLISNSASTGISIASSTVTVDGCTVRDFGTNGIYVTGPNTVQILNGSVITQQLPSRFRTGRGIYLSGVGSAAISLMNSTVSFCNNGIYMDGSAGTFSAAGNVITQNNDGFNISTIPALVVNNNDIVDNINTAVRVNTGGADLDFTNNWWGATDSAAVAAKIYDRSDNGSLARVKFVPVSEVLSGIYGPADITKDGRTDGFDLSVLGSSFGKSLGDAGYKAAADLNGSNRVDGFDLAILGIHFGEVGSGTFAQWKMFTTNTPNEVKPRLWLGINRILAGTGDTVSIDIHVASVPSLFAFSASLRYDPDKLNFIDCKDAGFISRNGSEKSTLLAQRNQNSVLFGLSLLGRNHTEISSGNGVIGTLRFVTKGPTIHLTDFTLSDVGLIAPDGKTAYEFELLAQDPNGVAEPAELPTEYQLYQNYPNPFNGSTIIRYALPEPAFVQIAVYDILGHKIVTLVDEHQTAGIRQVKVDLADVASGVYLYELRTDSYRTCKKLVLVR